MDSFWGITLRSMHYTEDTAWHQKTLFRVHLECDISKTIHNRHGKVYIKTFRNFSSLEMCECHSSTLDIGGVVAWNQQCSMTSQKGFIFSEPAQKDVWIDGHQILTDNTDKILQHVSHKLWVHLLELVWFVFDLQLCVWLKVDSPELQTEPVTNTNAVWQSIRIQGRHKTVAGEKTKCPK